jgi:uncharacterized protein YdeI (YjbR/CyaY-like superfamily)
MTTHTTDSTPFASRSELEAWLRAHHSTKTELWVRLYKKATGIPSVTWEDCVVAALCWGWIDAQKRSMDEQAFLQRLTPRRSGSNWSKINCGHAERLIAEGRMQPAGLVHVHAAKADGRWERAYAGSADMVFPDEFVALLQATPGAEAAFAALKRAEQYSIYHRIHTAKRPETRAKHIAAAVAALAEGLPKT